MNILIIGFGSIGQRHLKNLLKKNDNNYFVLKYSNNNQVIENCKVVDGESIYDYYHNTKFFKEIDDIDLKIIDAAFICNDSSEHLNIASKLLKYDIDMFIEKPVDSSLEKLLNFKRDLLLKKSIVVVGYQTRFHPVYLKVKEILDDFQNEVNYIEIKWGNYLPDFHKYEDYTKRYAGKANMGGGVLLTLSHEINILNSLISDNKIISSSIGKSKNFNLDVEDFVIALLKSDNIHVSLILSFSQVYEERYIKIQTSDTYIIGDFVLNKVDIYKKNNKKKEYRFSLGRNELFTKEVDYFFKCIDERKVGFNTIDESIQDLKLIGELKK